MALFSDGYDFRKIARKQERLFFRKILPRYIGAYFRGRGYYFIRKMLEDMDAGKTYEALKLPPPSPAAVEMAAAVRAKCPIKLCRSPQYGPRDTVVLGHFSHVERYTASALGPSLPFVELPAAEYRTTVDRKHVVLFEGSFASFEYSSRRELEYQVLLTIMHEYIHFFESFFLKSEQTLTSREEPPQGLIVKSYTLDEARRMDNFHIAKIWAVRASIALALASTLAILLR